jgi:putative membrane protein
MRIDSGKVIFPRGLLLGLLSCLASSLACASTPTPTTRNAKPDFDFIVTVKARPRTPSPALPPVMLDDAQIVEITRTAEAAELAQARLARDRSKHASVQTLARDMVSGHGRLVHEGPHRARASRSIVADELRRLAEQSLRRLEGTRGDEFDRSFVEAQIDQHRVLLDKLNSHLIPMARTSSLRNQLEATRTRVEGHLSQANATLWAIEASAEQASASASLP